MKTETGVRDSSSRAGRWIGSAEAGILPLFFAALLAMRLYFIFAYPFDSDESQHPHVAWGRGRSDGRPRGAREIPLRVPARRIAIPRGEGYSPGAGRPSSSG